MGDVHDKLLTPSQAAQWYGVSERTFSRWRRRGLLPRPTVTLPNGKALWSERDLRASLRSHLPEEFTIPARTKTQVAARPGQTA
jgi:predicted site-specific integrase-resolvase